jgi:telomerase reverse transcriptase
MAVKRKRTRHGHENGGDQKRQRLSSYSKSKDPVIKQAVLAQYYPQVLSLREFLLSKLPSTSKLRRKKINSVGKSYQEQDRTFADFLDQSLIGVSKCQDVTQDERRKQWTSFSQHAELSTSTFANTSGVGIYSQSEVGVYTSG